MPTNNKTNWVSLVNREHTPLFLGYLFSGQTASRLNRAAGTQISIGFSAIRKPDGRLQVLDIEFDRLRAELQREVKDGNPAFIEAYVQRLAQSIWRSVRTARKTRKEVALGSIHQVMLSDLLERYFESQIELASFLLLTISP